MKRKRKGFTLIEILVACAVIIALAAAAIFGVYSLLESGKYNKAKADVNTINTAIHQYFFETGQPPNTLDDLTVKQGSLGPWLDKDILIDPWGTEYFYTFYGSGIYYVASLGPDKDYSSNFSNSPGAITGDDIGICGGFRGNRSGIDTIYDGQKYVWGQNN